MPSKIETSLTPEQLGEFFKRCAQLKGSKLKDIAALAEEFGVEISLMSARSFKQGAFSEYLEELKAAKQMADDVTTLVADGTDLGAAAAAVFSKKVFSRALKVSEDEIGEKSGNNVSLAISRLVTGEQRSKLLEARLQEMERAQTEWEEKRSLVNAQLDRAKNAPAATADEVRAAAVAEIDRIMGIKAKK